MILEAVPLQIRSGQSAAFELAFREAQAIIAVPGLEEIVASFL